MTSVAVVDVMTRQYIRWRFPTNHVERRKFPMNFSILRNEIGNQLNAVQRHADISFFSYREWLVTCDITTHSWEFCEVPKWLEFDVCSVKHCRANFRIIKASAEISHTFNTFTWILGDAATNALANRNHWNLGAIEVITIKYFSLS